MSEREQTANVWSTYSQLGRAVNTRISFVFAYDLTADYQLLASDVSLGYPAMVCARCVCARASIP